MEQTTLPSPDAIIEAFGRACAELNRSDWNWPVELTVVRGDSTETVTCHSRASVEDTEDFDLLDAALIFQDEQLRPAMQSIAQYLDEADQALFDGDYDEAFGALAAVADEEEELGSPGYIQEVKQMVWLRVCHAPEPA